MRRGSQARFDTQAPIALGIQAGIGNFGVSLVQLLTPWLIGFSMFGFLGSQHMAIPGKAPIVVWYQNSALVYLPFIVAGAIWAYVALKSVPIKANIKQQFDIFRNQDTWWMTILYIMTFGTFSGLSAQFGLLLTNLYGSGNPDIVQGAGQSAQLLVPGYAVPDAAAFVFLGPLIGAGARVLFAPLTVFAAISGLIAERGLGVMVSAGIFMGEFYLTLGMLWAILIGLSTVIVGPCISRLTKAIFEPALLAFTTSSSEAAFPGTLDKLEKFGVSSKIASFVLPIGYSFNLVGSMAYCSFATVFIAQACNVHLSMGEQITMLLILMLTSKGMAGVPRASMVVIAATLNQFNIPEAGLILLMGVDPFLDMGRSATNVMSNAMGAAIVGRWEGEHYGEGCRGTAPVKKPEQERFASETSEVAMS